MQSKILTKFTSRFGSNFRKILANTSWLFGERVLQMGFALVTGVWVTRYLGPEQYGLFSYAMAFVGLFSVLTHLGLNDIVVRDLVQRAEIKNAILGTTLILRIVGCGLALVLVVISTLVTRPDNSLMLPLVIILSVPAFLNAAPFDAWFQSQVQAKDVVLVRNAAYIFMCGVRIILIQLHASLIAFAWVMVGESLLGLAGRIFVYQRNGEQIHSWKVRLKQIKSLLKSGWPLMLSGLVIMIYMRSDQIMLGSMIGSEAVGTYSAALKISELWYFVPAAIASSVFPSIIEGMQVNESLCYQRMQKLFNLMTLIAYGVALVIILFSTDIVLFLYGRDYLAASQILVIHIWTGLFVSLGLANGSWLIASGNEKFSAFTTALGAIVNVILNYWLIPLFGIQGAAIATLVAQIISAYLANSFRRKTRMIFILQTRSILLWDYWQNLAKLAYRPH